MGEAVGNLRRVPRQGRKGKKTIPRCRVCGADLVCASPNGIAA